MSAVRHRAEDRHPFHLGGGRPSADAVDSAHEVEWRRLAAEAELTEDQARHLILSLADRFGIALAYWTRRDIQARLCVDRELTPAEWDRVVRTEAWGTLPVLALDAVADTGQLELVVRQAGLDCGRCGRALPAAEAVTTTWGLCAVCRLLTSANAVLRADCAGHIDGEHERRDGHCHRCGVPMPEPGTGAGPR